MTLKETETGIQQRLTELLAGQKITQRELARRIGRKHSTVNNWFLGKQEPTASDLARIAEITDCSLDWLVLGKNTKFVRPILII